ncbi:MAG: hypothetical protein K6G37_02215, partial [Bacilli bacterium]|nr:hypothetical protein [Bacilli bacterium]
MKDYLNMEHIYELREKKEFDEVYLFFKTRYNSGDNSAFVVSEYLKSIIDAKKIIEDMSVIEGFIYDIPTENNKYKDALDLIFLIQSLRDKDINTAIELAKSLSNTKYRVAMLNTLRQFPDSYKIEEKVNGVASKISSLDNLDVKSNTFFERTFDIAKTFIDEKRYGYALSLLEKGFNDKCQNQHSERWYYIAFCQKKLRDRKQAIISLKHAIECDNNCSYKVYTLILDCYLEERNIKEAISTVNKLEKISNEAYILSRIYVARIEYKLKHYDEVKDILDHVRPFDPESRRLYYDVKINLALKTKDIETLVKFQDNKYANPLLKLKAKAVVDPEECIKYANKIMFTYYKKNDVLFFKGKAAGALGKYDLLEECFSSILESDYGDEYAMDMYRVKKEYHIQEGLDNLLDIAYTYSNKKLASEKEKNNDDKTMYYDLLSIVPEMIKRKTKADKYFEVEELLDILSTYGELGKIKSTYYSIELFENIGQYDMSLRLIEKLQNTSYQEKANEYYPKIYRKMGDKEAALNYINGNMDNYINVYYLSKFYSDDGNYIESLRLLDKIPNERMSYRIRRMKLTLLLKLGRYSEALDELNKLFDEKPYYVGRFSLYVDYLKYKL